MAPLRIVLLLALLALVAACSESTAPDDGNGDGNGGTGTTLPLTEEMEVEIVAMDIAENRGGMMADLNAQSALVMGGFAAAGDGPAVLDTAIGYQWLRLDLSAEFFLANGSPVPIYIPGLVDSIAIAATLSGDTTITPAGQSASWGIDLRRTSATGIGGTLGNTLRFHGGGQDNSTLTYGGALTFSYARSSTYTMTSVTIPRGTGDRIPTGGTVSGVAGGVLTSGILQTTIAIPWAMTFTGDATVTVSIDDGRIVFTINLLTGEITR